MSVCRFTEPFGKGKVVVASEKDRSSKMCLSLLCQKWRESLGGANLTRAYAKKDAMGTLTRAVEEKRVRYNASKQEPAWKSVPSATGQRGEISLQEVLRVQRAEVNRWVPSQLQYEASLILWHDPGGAVFVLKNKNVGGLTKLTRGEAAALAIAGGRDGLVICAFPCGYPEREPKTRSYEAASVSINGEELAGPTKVSFKKSVEWTVPEEILPEDWTDASGKRGRAVREEVRKSRSKKPEPKKAAASRFNVIEVDDEEPGDG